MEDRAYDAPPRAVWLCIAAFVLLLATLMLTPPQDTHFQRDTGPWASDLEGM